MQIKLTRKRFSVQLPDTDIERLVDHCILNTVPIAEMGFLIIRDWLEKHHGELVAYYEKLAQEQDDSMGAVEHRILGEFKRRGTALTEVTSQVGLALPIYDNRRLIGHAHRKDVSKAEMARRIIIPWMDANQGIIDKFYERAIRVTGMDAEEVRSHFREAYRQASRSS